jgi:carboxymethylenebutenolidase
MCDDQTEVDNANFLSRRALAQIGVGAMAATTIAGRWVPAVAQQSPFVFPSPAQRVRRGDVAVSMPDGVADCYFVSPARGRHPAVIVWPDVAGLRPAYRLMADRLAGDGYAVLVVNCYYRNARAPVLGSFAEWRSDAGRAKIGPMRAALTPEAVTSDGKALVSWLAARREYDPKRKMAAIGYCMGGPFTIRTAAGSPDRIGAVASFHGGGLATDKPDSPHLLFPALNAATLIAIAQNDDSSAPTVKDVLRKAAADAGRTTEIEVYPAQHGWCTIDSPVYDKAQSERAWSRMLAMFRAHL